MDASVKQIRQALKRNADARTRESGRRFFKEPVRLYGVKTAVAVRIARDAFKSLPDRSKTEIWRLCELLWSSGMLEEAFVACNWAYALRRDFKPEDFRVWERWVTRYVSNWAACDTFCNHTVGAFLERYPEFVPRLLDWAASPNRWLRRAAVVSLIVPAKRGLFLKDIFALADRLLMDQDDLVQKGYGWLLKAASQTRTAEVHLYIMKRKARMPRTALRYAIEKMPAGLRARAMAK